MTLLTRASVIAATALVLAGCIGTTQTVVTVTAPAPTATGEDTRSPSDESPEPAAPTTEPEPTAETLDIIESGTYLVPDEVAPGVYRVLGYWATLDEDMDIIDNDGVYEEGEFTLAVITDAASYVEISGEAVAVSEFPSYAVLEVLPPGGTYLVGADIPPGRYRISDSDYAYAARLDETLDIIDNEGNEGSVIITIQPGDFAFQYTGELTPL